MTNKIYSYSMAMVVLAISLIAGSCSKNDSNNPQEPAKVQKYHMVVNADKAQEHPANTPRRVLGLDGTTVNASWAVGEEVTVYNVTKNTAVSGVLTAQSNGARTTLSGDLTGIIEPSDILTLKFQSPDYTGQDGTLEYISAHCDYAEASVTVASVSGGNITSTADAVFENKQAVVRFTLMDKADGSTLLNPVSFTIGDGTSDIVTLTDIPAATYTANGNGVLFVAIPGFADKTIILTASQESDVYVCTKDHVTFANGSYYPITTKMTETIHNGALPGAFSVSPTKKVRFSRGNLQYQASTDTWRFAEKQYDIIGSDNSNISSSYSGWIDLFGWGTGNNPTESSENHNMYNSFTDWGVNAISNGGNAANLWRTLTKAEWLFLFCERNGANQLFGLGSVNNTYGLIILPDNWETPDGLGFTASTNNGLVYQNFHTTTFYGMGYESAWYENRYGNNFLDNTYTEAQWNIMESTGAIFLPCAGYRYGTNHDAANVHGCYWSSTIFTQYDANHLWFVSNKVNPQDDDRTLGGLSVRLVQD